MRAQTDEESGDLTYYMSQFEFTNKYSPGKTQVEADCLRRNSVLDSNNNDHDTNIKIVNLISMNEIMNDQNSNDDIKGNIYKLVKIQNMYKKKKNK